jgi:acyl carrier protein
VSRRPKKRGPSRSRWNDKEKRPEQASEKSRKRSREEREEKKRRENAMDQAEVFERVVKILTPWVKNAEALKSVAMETSILDDLKVNSARLVDVVIAFEDDFDIEIADEDVDSVNTVGNAVNLITSKLG